MDKLIPLTKGCKAIVDAIDYQWLNSMKWCYCRGYAVKRTNGKIVSMHRLILGLPTNKDVDHINGLGLDNRRVNLRLCNAKENAGNMKSHKDSSSVYKGVSWDKKVHRWTTKIQNKFVGQFDNERYAAMAYDIAAADTFGKYARLNFNSNLNERI